MACLISRFWVRFDPPCQQHDYLCASLSEIHPPPGTQVNAQFRHLVSLPVALTIATLFILAMVSLVAGLLFFLRKVQLSTGYIHVLPR